MFISCDLSSSCLQRGEILNTSGLNHVQMIALHRLLNPQFDMGSSDLICNFNISPSLEGPSISKPQYKDVVSKHLTESHSSRENCPVVALVENNSVLPSDVEFYE